METTSALATALRTSQTKKSGIGWRSGRSENRLGSDRPLFGIHAPDNVAGH